MSWTGLKKAINRAGQQVMLKSGQIKESADLEFDYSEKRYRALEKGTNRLSKELRHYKESIRLLTNAQASIGDVLAGFYGAEESSIAKVYQEAMRDIVQKGIVDLEEPYLQTVLNPVERFNSYYVDVNEAIKKRNHKKLDYDLLKTKMAKLQESDPTHPAHEKKVLDTQEQLAEAQEKYRDINAQLKDELPKLVDLRIPYLNPSFEAFVKIQLRFFSENYGRLNEVQKKLDASTREDYASGQMEKRLDLILDKIRELNVGL